ncbi:MAG: hypothetical protein WD250_15110 [Egibacteraceae bacterium]
MPKDKNFKRRVRARMTDTGERYTDARSQLRPDAAGQPTPDEPPAIDGVVPTGLEELQKWRRMRPWPVAGVGSPEAFGHRWELTVDAGGRLAVLEPPALDVGAVAALGRAAGGVGTIAFGLHMDLPAPEGCEPGDAPPFGPDFHEPLRRVHDELLRHLDLPGTGPGFMMIGPARRNGGHMVVPAHTGTTLLVGTAAGGGTVAVPGTRFGTNLDAARDAATLGRLDPSTWPQLPDEPWACYGVVLQIERDFPVQRMPTHPPAGYIGPWHVQPAIGELWDEAGRLLQSAAAQVGLPAWPLHEASLTDATSGWPGSKYSWQS